MRGSRCCCSDTLSSCCSRACVQQQKQQPVVLAGRSRVLVVSPAVPPRAPPLLRPCLTTGSKCTRKRYRPDVRGSWTHVVGVGIRGDEGACCVSWAMSSGAGADDDTFRNKLDQPNFQRRRTCRHVVDQAKARSNSSSSLHQKINEIHSFIHSEVFVEEGASCARVT